jgi:hypothetical protein
MNSRLHIGRRAAVLAGLIALAAALVTATAAQATTSPLNFAYAGQAYGSSVQVGNVFSSGPSFRALLGACTARAGDTNTNSGASTNVPGLFTTGTVSNTVKTSADSSSGTTWSSATVQKVNVLAGLISATAVQAVSRVTYTASTGGFTFSNGSHVLSIVVAGHVVNAAMNQKINLPGLGYVIVNETSRSVQNGFASQSVTMLHIYITVPGNVYGLKAGTNIHIARAIAGLHRPTAGGPVGGVAYGTHANVGNTIISGYSSILYMRCLGGSDTTSVASTNLPHIGSTGTIQTTTSSSLGLATKGHATSTVQTVNLLSGLIRATAVKADVAGSYDGITHRFFDQSTFTSLVVNGVAINANARSTIQLSGLGTLYVHRVIKDSHSYAVRMLELVVTVPNSYNLAVGTDVQVGVARVNFRD